MEQLPVIDVASLVAGGDRRDATDAERACAGEIDRACRRHGFFLVSGHGIDPTVIATLDDQARAFFALDESAKAEVAMSRGGPAWRGWFPLGGELTAGVADAKEGYYLGVDLPPDDPRVAAGLPLHGPNLYPTEPAGLGPAAQRWIDDATALGHALVRGVGLALGLGPRWFAEHLTADPTVLARIFRYPAAAEGSWGVAEHTDYGLLTILAHDGREGLEVRGPDGWIPVAGPAGTFVVNLGDMLEAMTGGRYRSTPHRVAAPRRGTDRLSFPVFFDPAFDARVAPLPLDHLGPPTPTQGRRWDGTAVDAWTGRYGDYLTGKVAQVFPGLGRQVLDQPQV